MPAPLDPHAIAVLALTAAAFAFERLPIETTSRDYACGLLLAAAGDSSPCS
jgi:hypothetical protein